jgi:hypothetical protein
VIEFKRICHPDRSEAQWRDLLFLSVHPIRWLSTKVTTLPFVIPTGADPDFQHRGTTSSRMKFANATKFDRKSGVA